MQLQQPRFWTLEYGHPDHLWHDITHMASVVSGSSRTVMHIPPFDAQRDKIFGDPLHNVHKQLRLTCGLSGNQWVFPEGQCGLVLLSPSGNIVDLVDVGTDWDADHDLELLSSSVHPRLHGYRTLACPPADQPLQRMVWQHLGGGEQVFVLGDGCWEWLRSTTTTMEDADTWIVLSPPQDLFAKIIPSNVCRLFVSWLQANLDQDDEGFCSTLQQQGFRRVDFRSGGISAACFQFWIRQKG